MSKESAVAFYDRLESEPELVERIKQLTVPEVERLVKGELGYDFTKEEIQKVIFEKNPEISDADLERVVGGLDGVSVMVGLGIGGGIGLGGAVLTAVACGTAVGAAFAAAAAA